MFGLQGYDYMIIEGGLIQLYMLQLKAKPKKEKQRRLVVLFNFWWMIRKERNNRIFESKEKSTPQLAQLI
jgi:hypothetical protein